MADITQAQLDAIVSLPSYARLSFRLATELQLKILSDTSGFAAAKRCLGASGLSIDEVASTVTQSELHLQKFARLQLTKLPGDIPEQQYPAGEQPPKDERDVILEVLGTTKYFLLMLAIEFTVASRGAEALGNYLKRARIPGASRYAKALMLHYTASVRGGTQN